MNWRTETVKIKTFLKQKFTCSINNYQPMYNLIYFGRTYS